MSDQQSGTVMVYIGTYTRSEAHRPGTGEGIYAYRLNLSSGTLSYCSTVTSVVNPSWLAFDPHHHTLYAVNEVSGSAEQPGGAVSAFASDRHTGSLTLLNHQPTHAAAPCYLSLDQTGSWVLVANYIGGCVTVLPIKTDGQLGPAMTNVPHSGSSIHPQRQNAPHPHCVIVDSTNRYALIADLGLDKIMVYDLDITRGTLLAHNTPWVPVKAGAGPRHLAFHPHESYLYCINELDSTIVTFTYDTRQGTLQPVQTISTLPDNVPEMSYAAGVQVAPSGRFVYASNRGHDSIAIFAVAERTGMLRLVEHTATLGRTPRAFAIDPTGTFLLVVNQGSDSIVTFRINAETGQLAPTGHITSVPTPVCVQMIQLAD